VAQGVPGRLRPRIFLTFRHYKSGRSSAKRTGSLYPRRNPWYSLSEAESTPGHTVLAGVPPKKKSPVTPPGIEPGTSRLLAQCLNHYATPSPVYIVKCKPSIEVTNHSLPDIRLYELYPLFWRDELIPEVYPSIWDTPWKYNSNNTYCIQKYLRMVSILCIRSCPKGLGTRLFVRAQLH